MFYLSRVEKQSTDTYLTLARPATGLFRDRGSKFLAYAYPVKTEEEAMEKVENLRQEHFKARHHCFAYRLGRDGNRFRANDDGEPSGTAGRPILGQIDSFGLTDLVVVVVRYFGGVKLGASGLIQAYKTSAAEALARAAIIEKTVEIQYRLRFGYERMGDVMSALERSGLPMRDQQFGDTAEVTIAIRKSEAGAKLTELKALIAGVTLDEAAGLETVEGVAIVEDQVE